MNENLPLADTEFQQLRERINNWFRDQLVSNSILASVEEDPESSKTQHIWHARILGEEKESSMLNLSLKQRMLHYETYLMPGPEENLSDFWEYLLRRNRRLIGVTLCIGEENAVYLIGAIPATTITEEELDRILGTCWTAVEDCFKPGLKIGFASQFNP
ncbi:MAG TPA: YbjN domain-containing protein [Acidimicrobiales bacterium]|nr:YbjN domain-containing protein [Acidimicrobiales bacterium]